MKATTEGVVRAPSAFSITFGALPSMMATHEFVVPRSMPIILLMRSDLAPSMAGGRGGLPLEAPVASVPGNVGLQREAVQGFGLVLSHGRRCKRRLSLRGPDMGTGAS